MEFSLHEVVPETCKRSDMGRIVVDPPNVMGSLVERTTGTIIMCCNRAFLTEEAYKKHLGDMKVHGRAVDFSKLPAPKFDEEEEMYSDENENEPQDYDTTNRNLWAVRKKENAKGSETEVESKSKPGPKPNGVTTSKDFIKRGTKICSLCGIETRNGNLNRHLQTCHVPDGIPCDYCSCTFLLNRGRLQHQSSLHGVRIRDRSTTKFKQSIVARAKKQLVTSSKARLISNQRKNARKSFTCTICGKGFPAKIRLYDHMNTHSGARPYECDICFYKFSHCSNLKRHKKTAHPRDGPLTCRICNCTFSNNYLLIRHNKAMHKNKLKKLNSPELKISTGVKKQNLEDSVKVEASTEGLPSLKLETPSPNSRGLYECNICHKELSVPQSWRGHMLIHQNLKPYKCKYCGIRFRLYGTMHQHIKVSHSGGPFKCKDCCCRYKSLRALERHIKVTHSEIKQEETKVKIETKVKNETTPQKKPSEEERSIKSPPKNDSVAGFKCNLCGTVVRLLEDFDVHKALHNVANSSQCNLCLKSFGSGVNVRLHKKRAHGDAALHIHKCAFCCCRYTTSQALYKHLFKVHEMQKQDWNFVERCIKPEARRRIQLKLCNFGVKSEDEDTKPTVKSSRSSKDAITAEITANSKPKDQSKKVPECEICHQRFKLFTSVGKHKKVAHNFGAYSCGLCPCRYHKLTWLKKHQLAVHGRVKLPNKDSPPPPKEDSQPQLSVGQSRQSPNNTIECNLCNFKFKSLKCLDAHKQKSHFHSGKFKCKQCPCKFLTMQGLVLHLSYHHGHSSKKKQKMNEMQAVNDSRNEENESNSEVVNEDTVGADGNDELETEVSLSDENSKSVKYFECDLCNMKFTMRSTIASHKKKSHFHSGKHKCSKCTCKFLSSAALHIHARSHNLIRNRPAKLLAPSRKRKASKSSVIAANVEQDSEEAETTINSDVKISTEPRIECDLCHLIVLRRKITTHKMTSHGSGTYSCPECTCVFNMPQGLVRHRVIYHKKGQNDDNQTNLLSTKENARVEEPARPRSSSKFNLNFLKIRSSPGLARRSLSKISSSPAKLSWSSSKMSSSPAKIASSPPKSSSNEKSEEADLYPSKPPRPAIAAGNYKFKCDLCGIKFAHVQYFRRHQEKAHIEGGVACEFCSCTFTSAGSLGAHNRIYHSPQLGGGVVVPKPLKKSVNTKLNFKNVTPSDVSKRSKKQEEELKSDLKRTTSKNVEKVEEASKAVVEKLHNTRSNKGEENTSRESSVDEHVFAKPSLPKLQHRCTWCQKAFSTSKLLEKHILCHTRPEICEQCGMRFRTKDEVSKHTKVAHDENSMHHCPVCACRFATAGGLKAHHTLIHKKQSASYDNIVIESYDEGVLVDNEPPFLEVGSAYSLQNGEDEFCEDSEPIVQGILETNYPSHGIEDYENEREFQEGADVSEFQDDVDSFDDSVPIVQGVMEYAEDEVEYPAEPLQPGINTNKKSFSPKSRPIKCSTCSITCFGPENLRLHMQSHHQDQEGEDDTSHVEDNSEEEDVDRKCEKCGNIFKTGKKFAEHLLKEHDESGLYRCAYCPCTMKNETNLRVHFMTYHSG